MPMTPHQERILARLRNSSIEQMSPEKRSKMIDDREEEEYHRAMGKAADKEHTQSHWGKGGKSNPESHTD